MGQNYTSLLLYVCSHDVSITRPHLYAWHKMRPIVTDVPWSVSVCLCLCVKAIFTPPRQTRENGLVCVASASAVWIGFPTTQDCRRQKIWSLNTFRGFVQFTPAHQTRHRQDCLVASGGRCEFGIAPTGEPCNELIMMPCGMWTQMGQGSTKYMRPIAAGSFR